MSVQSKKHQQALYDLQRQLTEGSDRIIEKICTRIRENPQGQPLILKFAKQVPTAIAQALTEKAIDLAQRDGYQFFGLIIDFEPD